MKAKTSMRALSLLLVVVLASAIFVPAVSAIEDESIIEKNYVSVEDAYEGSLKIFDRMLSAGAISDEIYSLQMIQKQPVEIYDVNGLILYYQFPIEKNGENLGFIRAAASKVLGGTVPMIKDNPDNVDYSSAIEKTEQFVKNKYSVTKDLDLKIVCYDYPKLGIMCNFKDDADQSVKLIFDMEQNLIPEMNPQTKKADYYSVYNEIDEDKIDANILKWNEKFNSESDTKAVKATYTRELWDSSYHKTQPTEVWCAVATGKMIAEWFGVTDSFEDIAEEMDSGTLENATGTTTAGELDYYANSPTGLCRDAELKTGGQITFYTGFYQIYYDQNPISSTLGKHTRACSGVYNSPSDHLFRIFDPSSDGNIYWEDYDTTTYITWILVD